MICFLSKNLDEGCCEMSLYTMLYAAEMLASIYSQSLPSYLSVILTEIMLPRMIVQLIIEKLMNGLFKDRVVKHLANASNGAVHRSSIGIASSDLLA